MNSEERHNRAWQIYKNALFRRDDPDMADGQQHADESIKRIQRVFQAKLRMEYYHDTAIGLTRMESAAEQCGFRTVAYGRDKWSSVKISDGRWNSPLDALESPTYRNEWRPLHDGENIHFQLKRAGMLPEYHGEYVVFYYSPMHRDLHFVTRQE